MVKTITISLSPTDAADEALVKDVLAEEAGVWREELTGYRLLRKSLDARARSGVKVILQAELFINEPPLTPAFDPELRDVHNAASVLIAGAGPAGLFAALKLISLGVKPIILERGKDVRSRRRDLAAMNKEGVVNPESNYCFGEGGAGTYSDGKLYTRSTKRGNVQRILQFFHHFGADDPILYEAHPHIGTNKLPQIITAMREAIIACGGEVHFNTKINGFDIRGNAFKAATIADGRRFEAASLILATGHSARDIFELLHRQHILIEAKPFAIGVRIEHPQYIIDAAQYHCDLRGDYLPPASYSLVAQEGGRGVFSFCMCPGGIIAPAATSPGEIVVNGWSPSKRNNPFANSGTVVTVNDADFAKRGFEGPLAALHYQAMVEQQCFEAGKGNLRAPAQRLTDFIAGKYSQSLPECSYLPGLTSAKMNDLLPKEVLVALLGGVKEFGKKMKGYISSEAVLVATESRTSSPVRVPRDNDTLQHPQIAGLYPCGEGAGYAGGIVSAAIDGERCAEMAASFLNAIER